MATIVALALPVIIGLVGLGVDSALLYVSHNRLQSAVDSAALAGSLELPYDPNITKGRVTAAVEDYLTANYPDAYVVQVAPGGQSRSVHVIGEVDVNLLLMDVLGINSKTIRAEATAGFNNLEIVFVIDNSGSMRGTPIQQTNLAAQQLVDLVMPEGMETSVKVGLVPFRGKVHIADGADGLPDGCRNADGTLADWLNDEYFDKKYRYPYYYDLQVSRYTCEAIPPVQKLTNDRTLIMGAIDDQEATGSGSGTLISEGIKWGREVLSPEAPYTEGSSDPDMRKIMIVLTDGDTEDGSCGGRYDVSYTPNAYWTNAYYGMLDMDSHCEDGGKLNQYMVEEANKAKAAGIEIFSVRFGESDTTDVTLMKTIASSKEGTDDHYFDAPSAYDIEDIFKLIGRQLGWRLLN